MIFLKKKNTWLRLLLRQASSLPFVFLDRRQSSLCFGFSQCQASDPANSLTPTTPPLNRLQIPILSLI